MINFLLRKFTLEMRAVESPLFAVERFSHDFKNDDVVMDVFAILTEDALRRRAREGCAAAKLLGQRPAHFREFCIRERRAVVAGVSPQSYDGWRELSGA